MFFSKTAWVLAWVAFVLGLLILVQGISTATGLVDTSAAARYVGPSPGRAIDRGLYTILFALALGTLAEISGSMAKLLSR